jgi:hypothetical protein
MMRGARGADEVGGAELTTGLADGRDLAVSGQGNKYQKGCVFSPEAGFELRTYRLSTGNTPARLGIQS